MTRRGTPTRALAWLSAAAVLALGAGSGTALAAGDGAAPGAAPLVERRADGGLSTRLDELSRPSVRSLSRAQQAARLSVARDGPGSLLRRGRRLLVDVRFRAAAEAGATALRSAGFEVVEVSKRHRTVTAAVQPRQLRALEHIDGVGAVREILAPLVHAAGDPGPVASAYNPCFGLETSEGDAQLRAAEARAKFEVEGDGIKVGILSDSFDQDPLAPTGAAEDIASGDLPGAGNPCGHTEPVEVLEDESEGSDEGRAMAQIVHDLAPGASLSFATAFKGELSFAGNIRALAAAGADAIVDDVSYFEEPFFQEGPIGVAVSDVTDEDVVYFSSAGNDNLIDDEGNDIGSWEAPAFRDAGSCPAAVEALDPSFDQCMDFDPEPGPSSTDTTFGITVEGGETLVVDLQWAEPWEGVTTDLDSVLLDSNGEEVIAGSAEDNLHPLFQRPLEIFAWENEGSAAEVQLAINRFVGGSPRLKFILIQDGGGVTEIEYPESSGGDIVGPTIFGHNGGEDAMTVGAIRFSTKSAPEAFSSRGPVTHYFGPVNGIAPAPLLDEPLVLTKPDVVASDGGANTFFGSCGDAWRFFGTSAAAPHATAVAALERDVDPSASAEEVKAAQRQAAVSVGAFPATAVGFGLIESIATLEELVGPPPSPGAVPVEAPPPGPCLPPRNPVPQPPVTPPTVTPNRFEGAEPRAADTTRPRTFFRKRPPKVVRTRGRRVTVVFRFGADEEGVSFVCRVDGGPFRPCDARLARRFAIGRHAVLVVARDAAGNTDATPAVHRFLVERRRG